MRRHLGGGGRHGGRPGGRGGERSTGRTEVMIRSGMISVSTGRQHRHGGRHGGDRAFVASLRPMQGGALRSLSATAGRAGNGGLPGIAAVATMIAAGAISSFAPIARGGTAFRGFVRAAAFLEIAGKVFVILHPGDDFFTVRKRFWAGPLGRGCLGVRDCGRAADVNAGNSGIDARASGVGGMDRQSGLGSSAEHVDVVLRRRWTLLLLLSGPVSRDVPMRRGIHHLDRVALHVCRALKVRQLLLLRMLLHGGVVMRMTAGKRRILGDLETGLDGLGKPVMFHSAALIGNEVVFRDARVLGNERRRVRVAVTSATDAG